MRRKVIINGELQPFDEQYGGEVSLFKPESKGNKIQNYSNDRLLKAILITRRLQAVNAFDDNNRLRLSDGSVRNNIDLIQLISYSISPGRRLVGLEEFVERCYEAGLSSEHFNNENVKAMLDRMHGNKPADIRVDKPLPPLITNTPKETQKSIDDNFDQARLTAGLKRKEVDPVASEQVEQPAAKKQKTVDPLSQQPEGKRSWDENDSDLDEQ